MMVHRPLRSDLTTNLPSPVRPRQQRAGNFRIGPQGLLVRLRHLRPVPVSGACHVIRGVVVQIDETDGVYPF